MNYQRAHATLACQEKHKYHLDWKQRIEFDFYFVISACSWVSVAD
jgi:hypothetical protein